MPEMEIITGCFIWKSDINSEITTINLKKLNLKKVLL